MTPRRLPSCHVDLAWVDSMWTIAMIFSCAWRSMPDSPQQTYECAVQTVAEQNLQQCSLISSILGAPVPPHPPELLTSIPNLDLTHSGLSLSIPPHPSLLHHSLSHALSARVPGVSHEGEQLLSIPCPFAMLCVCLGAILLCYVMTRSIWRKIPGENVLRLHQVAC